MVELSTQDCKRDGAWGAARRLEWARDNLSRLPEEDAGIVGALAGARPPDYAASYRAWNRYDLLPQQACLSGPLLAMLLPRMVATGRCWLSAATTGPPSDQLGSAAAPLVWDGGGAWQFLLEVARAPAGGWNVRGVLRRESPQPEQMDLRVPVLILAEGFVFTQDRVAALAPVASPSALLHFRRAEPLLVPDRDRDALLTTLLEAPALPPLLLPEQLRVSEVAPPPAPRLAIQAAKQPRPGLVRLEATLAFDYGAWQVEAGASQPGRFDAESRTYLRRDPVAEQAAAGQLPPLGFRFHAQQHHRPAGWELAPAKLPHAVRALVGAGWQVEAEGRLCRPPGACSLAVASGVDWFELQGAVAYGEGDAPVRLPVLLAALRRGEAMVPLADGSFGMLPEEWLRRFAPLAALGEAAGDHLRFRASQAGLLDALLATQPAATCDELFARARRELRSFEGIAAAEQPPGLCGHLRDYQREGLGWLLFLRRFGFGGCLADDMGVGKTAQVLALLELRRAARAAGESAGPALIVAPRSLIFNWKEEAARFTPGLRLLDYTGSGRVHDFSGCDAVLTTYGTLRREILRLKEVEFDVIVLDEAQAIKNAATASAKAARLLCGRQRLALSGTPVENHLGELWSLFEFLNPGMLGSSAAFARLDLAADSAHREHLAGALRPFILRRTKEQVARELPAKTEQTLVCEMKPPQRRLYDELRDHYRQALLPRVDRLGMAKAKLQVLEALLRLRQAACHPGLIDPQRRGEPSAKLETLMEQLREVMAAGHKALVFSQFTSLLRIVRDRLDGDGVVYEYLDGRTRDRQAKVERFQTDPACPLFLISLKAGGLGLNLTAAEYVFLLDPWWNPAVEAQAVDRAHRIGQTRQVFAYRLIVRDSIEEKVLALQSAKRDLASALVGGGASLMRQLRREDLEALLA